MLGHHSVSVAAISALVDAVAMGDNLEYSMPGRRLHWAVMDGHCDYTMKPARIHYHG